MYVQTIKVAVTQNKIAQISLFRHVNRVMPDVLVWQPLKDYSGTKNNKSVKVSNILSDAFVFFV